MRYLLLTLAFSLLAFPALAEDKPAAQDPAPAAPAEKADLKAAENFKDKSEGLKKDLAEKLEKLRKRLDEKQRRHFGIIYNNHNLIETVKTVRGSVGKAVDACSEKNPGLAGKMQSRFEDWKTAVNAKLTEAEGLTQSMIFAQDYAGKGEIEDALKAADTMRAHSQTVYEKVPVTSKEACEFLYEKMVETKDNMISLLGTTLISVPQEMQKAGNAEQPVPAPQEDKPEDKPESEPDSQPAVDEPEDDEPQDAPAPEGAADKAP